MRAPLLDDRQRIAVNGEEPCRERLAGNGAHVARVLIDAALAQIDVLQAERRQRPVMRPCQQRAVAAHPSD